MFLQQKWPAVFLQHSVQMSQHPSEDKTSDPKHLLQNMMPPSYIRRYFCQEMIRNCTHSRSQLRYSITSAFISLFGRTPETFANSIHSYEF